MDDCFAGSQMSSIWCLMLLLTLSWTATLPNLIMPSRWPNMNSSVFRYVISSLNRNTITAARESYLIPSESRRSIVVAGVLSEPWWDAFLICPTNAIGLPATGKRDLRAFHRDHWHGGRQRLTEANCNDQEIVFLANNASGGWEPLYRGFHYW